MRALILTHHPDEGPGTIGTFLSNRNVQCNIIPLCDGARIPSDALDYDSVISMGGPMNVYEEAKYPFLREETTLLKRSIGIGIPVLGVCLGAQMIAKAAGAAVVKSPTEEVGWFNVELTALGRSDRLLLGLPNTMEVFQWHGDMFHVPVGGGLLATSRSCPHQAFKFGSAYGLQFHVEVTKDMLKQWFAQDPRNDAILERMDKVEPRFLSCANAIFGNFFKLVMQYHRKHAPFHGGRCC